MQALKEKCSGVFDFGLFYLGRGAFRMCCKLLLQPFEAERITDCLEEVRESNPAPVGL